MNSNDKFIARLEEGLERKRMTKTQLSEKIGLSSGTLSKYYSNKISPKIETIKKIAKILEVDPMWLMGYDVPITKKSDGKYDAIIKKLYQLDEKQLSALSNMLDTMIPNEDKLKMELTKYEVMDGE